MIELSYLKCVGCGAEYSFDFFTPVHECINRGQDDANHILEKHLPSGFRFKISKIIADKTDDSSPYKLFKRYFYSYYLAKYLNIDFEEIVDEINQNLTSIGEPEFLFTPLVEIDNIPGISGKTIIKNETGNVSGSHKARHLMGNILYIEVLHRAGMIENKPKLAVYSCGNAALAAAAIAKAANYDIDVFIPVGVNQHVIDKLKFYEANIIECPRIPGETGDPCYNKFHDALVAGATPFSCSGPDNWSNIEGGQTLCLELMTELIAKNQILDSIVIQVGGGALASAAFQTLEEMFAAGILRKLPKIYAVQTEGGYPLVRAYLLLMKEIAEFNQLPCSFDFHLDAVFKDKENKKILEYYKSHSDEIQNTAKFIRENYTNEKVQPVLIEAAKKHMSNYMWSWELEPHSIAHGILDDITYDWFKIVQGMCRTGGIPITVDEEELKKYNTLAKELTGIKVDPTGSSGFAGYMKLKKSGIIPACDTTSVIYTGVER
ncbi:MAG TPA: pyridoxal-phosphate dependent enzyme [Victivallales bacterium]|nr:pyridoxal-phosphate dependent enzyme [Victivallales bacterium]